MSFRVCESQRRCGTCRFTLRLPKASWVLLASHAYPLSKWEGDFEMCKCAPGLLGMFENGTVYMVYAPNQQFQTICGAVRSGPWLVHHDLPRCDPAGSPSLPAVPQLAVRGHLRYSTWGFV